MFAVCVESDFAGFFAAEDVDLGPVSHSVSFVILKVVVIEFERVVVIVKLVGVAARLVVKLFVRDGSVVAVFVVLAIAVVGVVESTLEQFVGGCESVARLEAVEVALHDIDEEADDVSAAVGFLLDDVCEFVILT